MFGSKKRVIAKLKEAIKKYEDEAANLLPSLRERESVLRELRDILSVPDGQDIRVFARALVLDREANHTILAGAITALNTAEEWFKKQTPKKSKAKKSVRRRN
jgi:hypothetical protein